DAVEIRIKESNPPISFCRSQKNRNWQQRRHALGARNQCGSRLLGLQHEQWQFAHRVRQSTIRNWLTLLVEANIEHHEGTLVGRQSFHKICMLAPLPLPASL